MQPLEAQGLAEKMHQGFSMEGEAKKIGGITL
jgi:hypothetical protein